MEPKLTLKRERETLMKVRNDLLMMNNQHFNMAISCILRDCGTVACIGGHAWLTENPNDFEGASEFVMNITTGDELYKLFYETTLSGVTPAEGAQAIDNYLNGNTESPWHFIDVDEVLDRG
jgi:hypothetical protein